MNLFFETSSQAVCFLCMAPIGFAAAACLDANAIAGRFRLLLDVLVLLLVGVTLLIAISVLRENALRAYHLLGLLTGVILYTEGIGKLLRLIRAKIRLKHRE